MGYIGKTLSLLAVCMFGWYTMNIVFLALNLFYPNFHIPVIRPAPKLPPKTTYHNMVWQPPFEYDATVYFTEQPTISEDTKEFFNSSKLVWHIGPQDINQRKFKVEEKVVFQLPESLRTHNSTKLYAFMFVQKSGQLDPYPNIRDPNTAVMRASVLSIRPHTVDHKEVLLGRGSGEEREEREKRREANARLEAGPWVPHHKTRIDWEIVLEDHKFAYWRFPLDIAPYIRVNRHNSKDGKAMPYNPLGWENPISVRSEHWSPLTNQTTIGKNTPVDATYIEIEMSLSGVSLGWFRLCNHMHVASLSLRSKDSLFKFSEADVDSLKEMVYEANPLVLGLTMIAMAFHLLFEFLAYKEDVSFWSKNSDSNWQGISRTSIAMGVASSWIGLLYIWDRQKETSMVVVIGAAAGALVEAWKLTKLMKNNGIFNIISGNKRPGNDNKPMHDTARNNKSKGHSKAKEEAVEERALTEIEKVQRDVDHQTMWYMKWLCVPAMIAYSTFSLMYQKHESYYSWFLYVSLSTVYTLEFIQMWPQLLINHRLKSVDMLPLTAFLYKFLVTFTDDLFALVVPMPLISRLGTLRDDVVFFVLCYQWYKFPRRKNEDDPAANLKSEEKEKTE